MKKTLIFILTLLIINSAFVFSANATSKEDLIIDEGQIVDIEYLDNGDYIETVIYDLPVISTGDAVASTTTTVTKAKTKNYKNSAGDVMWSIIVKGVFSYNGTTSKCTNVAHKVTSYASSWTIKSASSSKSGNTATAKATMVHHTDAGNAEFTASVSIKCSKTGVIS